MLCAALTALASIARLCRNQSTPVDIAPTMKEARAIATATSTGTSTSVCEVVAVKAGSWFGLVGSSCATDTCGARARSRRDTGATCSGPRTVTCCRLDSAWRPRSASGAAHTSSGSTQRLMLPRAPAWVAEHSPMRHCSHTRAPATRSGVSCGRARVTYDG